jgi:uncharacterized protein YbaR (Trm112 family)
MPMPTVSVTSEAGRTWCRCPACRQKLAERVDDRLVIAKGPVRIVILLRNEQELVCWRCGETVTVPAVRAIAA